MAADTGISIIQGNAVSYPRNQALSKVLAEFMQKDAKSVFVMWPASGMLLKIIQLKYIKRKQIIFDAFTSMYDSSVNDRKTVGRYSLKAAYLYLQDYLYCHLSDHLIFDTESHKDYFFTTFGLKSSKKYTILPVCVDLERMDGISPPAKGTHFDANKTNILFYGSFIPLQGVQYTIEAASLINDPTLHFWIIGNGQTHNEMRVLADKLKVDDGLTFLPSMDYDQLMSHVKEADVCLGIFGDTEKAQRVIPNKVLEYAACSKPVITGCNPELKKYFKDGESVIFCPMADAKALADKIQQSVNDVEKLKIIGANARTVVERDFNLKTLRDKIQNLYV
ncbi:MAG: glycosyltransferase [Patescibacteria group bacterium]